MGTYDNVIYPELGWVDGAIYNFTIDGEDFAGNVAKTIKISNINFDITPPNKTEYMYCTKQGLFMQEIQSILTKAYSSFSHFAIDQQILQQWQQNLSNPIEPNSLLLECLPTSLGLERSLDVLLLSNILPQKTLSDDVLPSSFQYAKDLATIMINGVNITDRDIVLQLDDDDLLAIFNLYSNPERLGPLRDGFREYIHLKNQFGSLLNLFKQTHHKMIDIIGALVQIIPL